MGRAAKGQWDDEAMRIEPTLFALFGCVRCVLAWQHPNLFTSVKGQASYRQSMRKNAFVFAISIAICYCLLFVVVFSFYVGIRNYICSFNLLMFECVYGVCHMCMCSLGQGWLKGAKGVGLFLLGHLDSIRPMAGLQTLSCQLGSAES